MVSDDAGNRLSEGATKIIDRVPRIGKEHQLEAAIRDITDAMGNAPGINSVHVVRPTPPHQPAYRVICTFDSDENLHAWDVSNKHTRLVAAADEFTEGEPQRTWLTGLETWFTLPVSANAEARPPAYKMAIATYVALFPTILLVHAVLAYVPEFGSIPTILANGIAVAIVVILMTYVIMPRFTRLMAFWLYPHRH
ncbi:hypothetical protein HW561_02685 [Rhodobacteraceae bacterium B1Z28]|uniref:ABM domain-containing protein n=1 Tax=Ruegeria haliotis TaxID=2747601 RepID=A0ABX2PLP4_9RHOB|nr:hypothetical protein [Ruegeria haliotis]NVO54695.1 hypothetical protein [Ruegeria haliotis]